MFIVFVFRSNRIILTHFHNQLRILTVEYDWSVIILLYGHITFTHALDISKRVKSKLFDTTLFSVLQQLMTKMKRSLTATVAMRSAQWHWLWFIYYSNLVNTRFVKDMMYTIKSGLSIPIHGLFIQTFINHENAKVFFKWKLRLNICCS